MLDNNLLEIISYLFILGIALGLSLGFVIYLVSWVISQLIHFFSALSK